MAYPSPPRSLSVVGWSVCGIADHSDLPDWSAKPYFAGLLITLWPDSIYRTLCGTRLMPSAISRSFLSPGNPLVNRDLLSSSLCWGGWDERDRLRLRRDVTTQLLVWLRWPSGASRALDETITNNKLLRKACLIPSWTSADLSSYSLTNCQLCKRRWSPCPVRPNSILCVRNVFQHEENLEERIEMKNV